MKANAVPLIAIFEKKLRLEVPLFQRQYVWNQEKQWQPLWEDISRKITEYMEGRTDAPVHFLGALVLDQKQTPVTHVERRQVIDGQQRLTTLQVFLNAFRDFCAASNCEELARECEGFTINKGMMAEPDTERYKVWPTQSDRQAFKDVVNSRGREALKAAHPLKWRKYARKPEPRPALVNCYLFFYEQIEEFFIGAPDDLPLLHENPICERLETAFQAMRNSLFVVTIDLDQEDDAQVIFETLNARGEPLLPADLLRNYIFLRASRLGEDQEKLYTKYWSAFDDEFWRSEISQGRINRPRSDLFMQHFLASQKTVDIPVKHLYVEYRHWIEKSKPFGSVEDELVILNRFGSYFRSLIEPEIGHPLKGVSDFLINYDVSTAYPFLLTVLDSVARKDELVEIGITVESYVLRRAICGLTPKNLNRVFLSLARQARAGNFSAEKLRFSLRSLVGESVEWPTDERFASSWHMMPAYGRLSGGRVPFVLARLSDTYFEGKSERLSFDGDLTVEHIMPQSWQEHWPLPSGARGMDFIQAQAAEADDPRLVETRDRDRLVQTWGNLTLLTQSLNSSNSNGGWSDRRANIQKYSVLPMNNSIQSKASWDNDAIKARGEELLRRAVGIWPRRAD